MALRRAHALIAALALEGLLACSGTDTESPFAWRSTVDTVGDTVVVRTLSGSVWEDTATFEEEVRIGVLDGPDEYILGSVSGVAVTRSGDIYVVDQQVPAVRKYAPDGTYLGDLGREGGGPGEYRRPESIAILPDGRMLLRDPGNGRINIYGPDGGSLTSWRLPAGGTFHTSRPLYVDTAGNTFTMVLLVHDADVTEWTYGLARYNHAGEITDTLRVPTWEHGPATITARSEGSSSSNSVPFSPDVAWTYSRLGYFIGGVSTNYCIDLFRIGEPVLRIERV